MTGSSVFDTTVFPTKAAQREAHPTRFTVLTLISHPDPTRVGARFGFRDTARADVPLSRAVPLFAHPGCDKELPLLDPFISREPLMLSPQHNGDLLVSVGGTRTPVWVGGDKLTDARLIRAEELEKGIDLILADRVVLWLNRSEMKATRERAHDILGGSDAMAHVWDEIDRIADLDVSVLLRGETGTGKELLAQALHGTGRRKRNRLICVNLASVPPGLAASELFGTERGAFPGALHAHGYFREADGGTLFLDEIGEAPPDVQTLLLRVLESGEIYPVGSRRGERVDVRLIAATDTDLEAATRSGAFKGPLLHRLSGYEIWLPPLRSRREDLGRLMVHFAREALRTIGTPGKLEPARGTEPPWIPAGLAARLCRCRWPGNVRQLRNVIHQLVIGSRDLPCLVVDPKAERLLEGAGEQDTQPAEAREARRKPSTVSAEELKTALEDCAWDLKATAIQLRISRTSLYALIDKTPGLSTATDLDEAAIHAAYAAHHGDPEAMAEALQVSARALRYRLKKMDL